MTNKQIEKLKEKLEAYNEYRFGGKDKEINSIIRDMEMYLKGE